MAVTAFYYAGYFIQVNDKEIDFLADSMKVALTTSSYTPNQDTHDYFDDVTNELTTANGYTAGGDALDNKVNSNTNNVVKFDDTNDTTWTSSGAGFTARRAVLYDSTPGTAATNPLMLWIDFGQDETASGGGTFTIAYHANGIATITPADATGFP